MDELPDYTADASEQSDALQGSQWMQGKSLKQSAQSAPESKYQLLKQLLELKTSQVTNSMIDFLADEVTCQLFFRFITLVDPKPEDDSHDEASLAQRAVSLVTVPSNPVLTFHKRCISSIVKELYRVFEPAARGTFQHFLSIHNFLTRHMLDDYVRAVAEDNCFRLLEPSIATTNAISIVTILLQLKPQDPHLKKNLFRAFGQSHMLQHAFKSLCAVGSPEEEVRLMHDFISRVLAILAIDPAADHVFISFAESKETIAGLLNAATHTKEKRHLCQKQECASLYVDMMQKSIKKPEPEAPHLDIRQTPTNNFSFLREALFTCARDGLRPILNAMRDFDQKNIAGEIKFSSYNVSKGFSSYRIFLMDIICEVLKQNPDDVLNVLDTEFWKLFVKWFFEYKNNNLYHCDFAQLFEAAMLRDHAQAVEILLKKAKIIQQLIAAFDEPAGNRGFVIRFCNIIRLANDTPGQYENLRRFLVSYPQWKSFVGKLREETERQTKKHFKVPPRMTHQMHHDDHHSHHSHNAEDDESIELGSEFARKLGLTASPAPSPATTATENQPDKKKKKKKNKKKGKKASDSPQLKTNLTRRRKRRKTKRKAKKRRTVRNKAPQREARMRMQTVTKKMMKMNDTATPKPIDLLMMLAFLRANFVVEHLVTLCLSITLFFPLISCYHRTFPIFSSMSFQSNCPKSRLPIAYLHAHLSMPSILFPIFLTNDHHPSSIHGSFSNPIFLLIFLSLSFSSSRSSQTDQRHKNLLGKISILTTTTHIPFSSSYLCSQLFQLFAISASFCDSKA
eukprot:TRINITY_DN5211_c0_g1_i2.p1 TRINITY_DN5211_c0_g1~~TRINITY_DN5211_c0_g1_i2.p1  ORF type:complete len:792 (+),score=165.84 TRINITY_DN5211_c0_g1_i2:130-2505(+)